MKQDFSNYVSPFSWRYGSDEMRLIWSEQNKVRLWRKIWVALAEAQHKAGLVSAKELQDLKKHEADFDIERIVEIEAEIKHDVMAAIREYGEKAKVGGGKIHLGATSMDVVDNADIIRIKEALTLIEKQVKELLKLFAQKIEQYAKLPCMGYTHLQPAEPTTVGYRLSIYAQDLLIDTSIIRIVEENLLKGKGLKGAVGTAASYHELLQGNKITPEKLEKLFLSKLGLEAFNVTTQVYPRKVDFWVLSLLASVTQSVGKFAEDLRILQSPSIGEMSEPFGKKQVGSSAMPFKKNPVSSEKICSLARYIMQLPPVALQNAMLSHLERTLDDSANKRIISAEAFIGLDEILKTAINIVSRLVINEERIKHNLETYGPFAATEAILMETVKKGANRQTMHELLRELSLRAWFELSHQKPNPLTALILHNKEISKYLDKKSITRLLDASTHVGTAPERALKLVKQINTILISKI